MQHPVPLERLPAPAAELLLALVPALQTSPTLMMLVLPLLLVLMLQMVLVMLAGWSLMMALVVALVLVAPMEGHWLPAPFSLRRAPAAELLLALVPAPQTSPTLMMHMLPLLLLLVLQMVLVMLVLLLVLRARLDLMPHSSAHGSCPRMLRTGLRNAGMYSGGDLAAPSLRRCHISNASARDGKTCARHMRSMIEWDTGVPDWQPLQSSGRGGHIQRSCEPHSAEAVRKDNDGASTQLGADDGIDGGVCGSPPLSWRGVVACGHVAFCKRSSSAGRW